MKKNQILYTVPAALALVTTLILVLTIPGLRTPYHLRLLETETAKANQFYGYHDLDGDGLSELLSIFYNHAGNLAITVRDYQTSGAINQFNFPGELTELGPILDLQDIDSDGILDILVCTEHNDSLFLSVIDDPLGHRTRIQSFFLDPINRYNDDGDYHFSTGGLSDLDGDGSPEYVCAINGGHSLQPRRVYALNFRTGQVTGSPASAAAVIGLDMVDLDRDGMNEILVHTTAPENFKFPFPYMDSISWLMILDHELEFSVPPVPLAESKVRALVPFHHEGQVFLLLLQYLSEPSNGRNSQLILFDHQGRILKKRYLSGERGRTLDLWSGSQVPDLGEVLLVKDDHRYHLGMDLEFIDSSRHSLSIEYQYDQLLDLDNDGRMEYVYLADNEVVVYRDGLESPAVEGLFWDERVPRKLISAIRQPGAYPLLFVQAGDSRGTFIYKQNPWFQKRALVYPGIFAASFSLLLGLFFLMDRIIARRYEKDRLIHQLQLQSIKNQLDPHFTYNALNAVGSLIYKEEKDLAYNYLKGLTDLLRMVSGDASTITWTLAEELEFVQKYLDIEKLRFRDRFQFQVSVEAESLKEMEVPKMSILTFVENAIKHGLRHKKERWHLTIAANSGNGGLVIGIRDNGIGRAAALKYREESNGQGTEMMRQYFRQFGQVTGKSASFEVRDLYDEHRQAEGTYVEINISS